MMFLKQATKGNGEGQIIPSIVLDLGMDAGKQPHMKPNHNVQQLNQPGNKIPILGRLIQKIFIFLVL